jgi:hypothetical protein
MFSLYLFKKTIFDYPDEPLELSAVNIFYL